MAKADEDMEAAIRAAKREGAAEANAKIEAKQATFAQRALSRGIAIRDRALADMRATPNKTQIVAAGLSAVGGTFAGYWANQYFRRKTAEWGWINEEDQSRSWGSILVADVAPLAVGAGAVFLGAFVVKHAALASALVGAGLGVAGGSLLSTVLGPDSGLTGNAE